MKIFLTSRLIPTILLASGLAACSGADPKRNDAASSAAPSAQNNPQRQSQDALVEETEEPTATENKDVAKEESKDEPAPVVTPPATPAVFTLSSPAFQNNQPFPALYVAKGGGGNQSPPLEWKGAPAGTGSFVIQMVDLDFRVPPFIHWLITGIPASSTKIPAAIPAGNNLAAPLEAKGASQPKAYAGPNPPNLHRYEITVYAIKQGEIPTLTTTDSAANKAQLEAKSLGKSVIIGTYQ